MADIFNDEVVDAWAAAAAADAEFQLLSRGAELPLELFCDDDSRRLQIRLGEINARPAAEDSPLILRGTSACWSRFLQPVPPRFHTDVMGMQRRTVEFSIEGRTALLQQYVALLHRMFELARTVRADRG